MPGLAARESGPRAWDKVQKWATRAGKFLHTFRRVLPVLVSAGLLTWLIWKITPAALARAFSTSHWPWLVLATVVQLIVLFLWDAVGLWWLFCQPDRRVPWRTVLRARTDSALWSAVSLEIGQGVFAWKLAQVRGEPVIEALGRCMVLALFDFGTLQALGLIGSFLTEDPLVHYLRWVCVASLSGLLLLALGLHWMPAHWRQWVMAHNWGCWLRWWTWRHSVVLAVLRTIMFLLVFAYVGVGLALCHIPVSVQRVFALVPFVLIIEALPGTAGLGTRETALIYLFGARGDQQAVLLSFGLIWSLVIIVGRLSIGLVSEWLPRKSGVGRQQTGVRDQESGIRSQESRA
jgi:hypothetical protein